MIPQTRFTAKELDKISKSPQKLKEVTDELNRILVTDKPSNGLLTLDEFGIIDKLLPELSNLKGVEIINNKGHKDIFVHTLKVVDNIVTYKKDLNLSWAALLHDIGKANTKVFNPETGWTFHQHHIEGANMVKNIMTRLNLTNELDVNKIKCLVELHMQPSRLFETNITDSAIRRMITEAGEYIDDLLILAEADITSSHQEKINLSKDNINYVKSRVKEIQQLDKLRSFKNPINGNYIMEIFGIEPSSIITELKDKVRDAILSGEINNDFESASRYLITIAHSEFNIVPVV